MLVQFGCHNFFFDYSCKYNLTFLLQMELMHAQSVCFVVFVHVISHLTPHTYVSMTCHQYEALNSNQRCLYHAIWANQVNVLQTFLFLTELRFLICTQFLMQHMQTNLARSIQKNNIVSYHMQILSCIRRPVIAYIALYNSKPVATQELYSSANRN